MNLSSTLQALKSDKKKLIIIGVSALVAIILIDIVIFVVLTKEEEIPVVDNDAVDSLFTEVIAAKDSTLDSTAIKISELIELYNDSTHFIVEKESDTCIVRSDLKVPINKYNLTLSLTYYMYPHPEQDAVRLIRLFNYRLGKILEENQMDEISIENFEKEFNMFLTFGINEHPYKYSGNARAELHEFKLE